MEAFLNCPSCCYCFQDQLHVHLCVGANVDCLLLGCVLEAYNSARPFCNCGNCQKGLIPSSCFDATTGVSYCFSPNVHALEATPSTFNCVHRANHRSRIKHGVHTFRQISNSSYQRTTCTADPYSIRIGKHAPCALIVSRRERFYTCRVCDRLPKRYVLPFLDLLE